MLSAALLLTPLLSAPQEEPSTEIANVRDAGALIGIELTDAELELMLPDVFSNLRGYEELRTRELSNAIAPALRFVPTLSAPSPAPSELPLLLPTSPERPADLEDLAFADITTLASLIKSKRVSVVELTAMYLDRLERINRELHCVITLTRERALEQARVLDAELAAGTWRGPLHGIPWGAKDLLSVRDYPTTWGAAPYRDQVIDVDAAVVEQLDAAGAVLIAKLTLGALAWGDVWYGETTRNPWNPEQGSSGSSAGPASAVSAGGVVFAIGSETLGSIVSPSDRCGVSSLRPTFGLVSRHGAMALSWSMDKLGPMCRSLDDAAIVMRAIAGYDARDLESVPQAATFHPSPRGTLDAERLFGRNLLRIGYLEGAFEENEAHFAVLEDLEALAGDDLEIELIPVTLPDFPVGSMGIILNAEAASAFDELTRSGRDDELTRQIRFAWPNTFRVARLIPAVEYIRANRLRTLMIRDVDATFAEVDVLVHPSFAGSALSMFNLTGHPTAVAPCAFRDNGTPFSISFTGKPGDDGRLLAIAAAWQRSTKHHLRHPSPSESR